QAIGLSYVCLGFVAFLFPDTISLPRSVLPLAWFLTLVLLMGARFWPVLWQALVQAACHLFATDHTDGTIKNVLVIGGAGYIGSALTRRLLELGYKVRVLDLLLYGDASISDFYGHPKFELVKGDFRHVDTVVSATRSMDAIVHLGAIVGDSACSIDQDLTIEINLRATRTIAEVGKGFGVRRFIFASTCSVYGASDEILDERSILCPISLYARTKMESEKMLLSLTNATFAPTILRFGTIYGLSGRPRFDLVVNLLTARAIQDGKAGIFGGRQWRPLVHVKDVAEAIVITLQAPLCNVRGQVFNVGSNEQNYQIADLGLMVKEAIPTARIITQPREDNRNYQVRFDKIRNVLNFQPRYTVRDGIQEIIDAFATGKITDYQDPNYSNFSSLKLNSELQQIFLKNTEGWGWIKLSSTDAMRLAEVIMAVIESESQELMGRLRESLVQAILGDMDGFLDILTGIQLTTPMWTQAASTSSRRPVLVEPRFEGRLPTAKPVSA
ncbi:MAG: NAD-dependent epimerase/dehydratase family protein, partial [Chloroflexota bacterium]|nr:NAD-dependent epimerase/dehydratase family protein [Chloroflexota bacterium]